MERGAMQACLRAYRNSGNVVYRDDAFNYWSRASMVTHLWRDFIAHMREGG